MADTLDDFDLDLAFGHVERVDDTDAVDEALRAVGMHERVAALSRGRDTRLGRRFADAEQLSIGQWQRLAFARALRGDPRLLLADEPAASLDADGEHAILRAVSERRGRMTTIMVTHSLAALRAADAIVYVDGADGAVHGPSTHAGLLSRSRGYRALHERLLRNGSPAARSSDADAEPSRTPA